MEEENPNPKRRKRTDPHRPGAIVPAEYEFVLGYSLATNSKGSPVPGRGVNCETERCYTDQDGTPRLGRHRHDGKCCVDGLMNVAMVKMAPIGMAGKCSVCGTKFVKGDVWKHIPTGHHIHIGHQCADKYRMTDDVSMLEVERRREHSVPSKMESEEEIQAFLKDHAFRTAREIVASIRNYFVRNLHLSEKQMELVFRLSKESKPTSEPTVDAPVADRRVKFHGTVVGLGTSDELWGRRHKMTVKVTTPKGVWFAHGTCPASLCGKINRGSKVEMRATLRPGREKNFAFMRRPVGKVIQGEQVEMDLH